MPLVSKPIAFACRAERLTRAAGSPDWPVVWPSGAAQGVAPDADAGEEMALSESFKVVGSYIFDAPFVYDAGRDVAGFD